MFDYAFAMVGLSETGGQEILPFRPMSSLFPVNYHYLLHLYCDMRQQTVNFVACLPHPSPLPNIAS